MRKTPEKVQLADAVELHVSDGTVSSRLQGQILLTIGKGKYIWDLVSQSCQDSTERRDE